MNLVVVCSKDKPMKKSSPFNVTFDNIFAKRFIKHITNVENLCTGCGKACVQCRDKYNIDFGTHLLGVVEVPSDLPYYLDAGEYYVKDLPSCDVVIAIGVHSDVLLALPDVLRDKGVRALIIPIEHPDWASGWVRQQVGKRCRSMGIEVRFPKPFCALNKGKHVVINAFIDFFRIGYPIFELQTNDENRIKKAVVKRSAPCGNSYYVAHNLVGKKVDDELINWVSKYWHSYPCVASMKMDMAIGDTILHKGGHIHHDAIRKAMTETKIIKI
jgi:hypothetical protein